MTLDSSGYVGIGTTTPVYLLDINGSSDAQIGIRRAAITDEAAFRFFTTTTAKWFMGMDDNSTDSFYFYNYGYGDYMMTLEDTTGYVGIGTSSPSADLSLSDGTDTFDFDVFTNTLRIHGTTVDGADDQRVIIGSTDTESSTRGGYVSVTGNEYTSLPGVVTLQTGNFGGAGINFRGEGGNIKMFMSSSGQLGIGTAVPIGKVETYISDNETDVTTNWGANQRVSFLARNASTTAGSYAAYDFRAGTADARIAMVYQATNDGDMQFIMDNTASPLVAMTIENDGEVGIGTTTPAFKFHIYSSDNTVAKFESSDDTAAIWIRDNDSTTYVGAAGSTSFIGVTGALSDSNLNIDTSGYVGIGTTNPGSDLQIGKNDNVVPRLELRYSTVPTYLTSHYNGSEAFTSLTTNAYDSSAGSTSKGTRGNASYSVLQYKQVATTSTAYHSWHAATTDAFTELMRLTHGGDVGIGTTNPIGILNVSGSYGLSTCGITFGDTSVGFHLGASNQIYVNLTGGTY
jgi:hypothetical protein